MNKFFPYLILLVALIISATSGYYSIIGLTKLFAGAVTEVIVLGISLELAKIIITTSLQKYWLLLSKSIKIYLISAIIILMLITSAGIYGFLSSAYQNTVITDTISTKLETAVDNRIERYTTLKSELVSEYNNISNNIKELQQNKVELTDKNYILALKQRDKLLVKIDRVNDSIESYDSKKIVGYSNNTRSTELSSLKYISKLTGIDMDSILNYFLFLIIFVFDPLALSMLLIFNSITIKLNEVNLPQDFTTDTNDDINKSEILIKDDLIQNSNIKQPTDNKNSISNNTIKKNKERGKLKKKVQIRGDNDNILSKEQMRDMSHQTIHKILSERNTT